MAAPPRSPGVLTVAARTWEPSIISDSARSPHPRDPVSSNTVSVLFVILNCKRYRLLLHAFLSPRLCLYLTRPILHLSQPCTCPGRQVGSSRPLLPLCCPHTPGLFLLNF